jgi:uncharacterized membrane protein
MGPLPQVSSMQGKAWWCAIAAWIGLIVLALAWELQIAPLRSGGSWLALKVVPLLLPLPALLRGGAYAMQLAIFISMLYLFEGAARVFEAQPVLTLAMIELALAVCFLAAAIVYLRPMKIAARHSAGR